MFTHCLKNSLYNHMESAQTWLLRLAYILPDILKFQGCCLRRNKQRKREQTSFSLQSVLSGQPGAVPITHTALGFLFWNFSLTLVFPHVVSSIPLVLVSLHSIIPTFQILLEPQVLHSPLGRFPSEEPFQSFHRPCHVLGLDINPTESSTYLEDDSLWIWSDLPAGITLNRNLKLRLLSHHIVKLIFNRLSQRDARKEKQIDVLTPICPKQNVLL